MATKDAKGVLEQRKRAYSLTFAGPHGEAVIEDLARYCKANDSCFDADARIHAVLEGRRQVFLRISNYLNLTESELFSLILNNQQKGIQ